MPAVPTAWAPNRYPPAHRSDHVDVYQSEKRGDWLEENSSDTDAWTTAQEAFTREYLDKNPERQELEDEIRNNLNYAKDDGRWYWYYNSGLQAQSVLYRSKDSTLPDFSSPNLLSTDGTAALATTAFSRSGDYWAYGISQSGSDFFNIYVRPTSEPLASLEDSRPSHDDKRLPDELRHVKFSGITWTHDNKGFFYQVQKGSVGIETKSDKDAMLYYHKVGTPTEDVLIYKDPSNPTWMWGTEITEVDGRYLILTISRDTGRKYLVWVADLEKSPLGPDLQWDKLVNDWEAEYQYIANDGTKFYFVTNKDAPRYKLLSVDLADPPEKRAWTEVMDEIHLYELSTGKHLERIALIVGSAESWWFTTLSGFTNPGIVGRYDFKVADVAQRYSVYRQAVVPGINSDEFTAEQVWYTSKDGTRVPMFIVRHRDTPRDGTAAALQYGYGGFSYAIGPSFSSSILTWHNCFDDFIAAQLTRHRQYLVDNKYAAPGKIAMNGGSNGGLLVAACVNRAAEGLIGAAVADVGVLDMLKSSGLPMLTWAAGRAWTSDYGDPHDPHDFDFIYPISPLHNIPTDRVLPPLMLTTADHDDRVVPAHSFKHAATLQHMLPHNPNPLIIRIDKNAGHGAGKSTQKRIQESADRYGFIVQSLGLKPRSA
ncbi:prolyl oligopeptidase [Epithele typhae]|uniref:prolyl oligopeptidase n=1 Tax=Epithele typhae TaxID=378194 RepID=UPI0020075A56|nr:prolyl oligopeptidase [Epithele typhae]KAH9921497.1 prolyl oligopeptidase [Epithele typhae]